MIRNTTARRIANDWHGGGWSALFQFGSSGIYLLENHLRYLQEVERDLHPEYDLHPSELTKKEERDLNALKDFFISQGMDNGVITVWEKHETYGYMIPYLHDDTPGELVNKIKSIYYMK